MRYHLLICIFGLEPKPKDPNTWHDRDEHPTFGGQSDAFDLKVGSSLGWSSQLSGVTPGLCLNYQKFS